MKSLQQLYKNYAIYFVIFLVGIVFTGGVVEAQTTLFLQADIVDYQSVLLRWDSDSEQASFQIHRREKNAGEYTLIATVSGQMGMIQCYDYDVKMGKTYYYKIVQLSNDVVQNASAEVCLQVKLTSPKNVKGKVIQDSRVKLSWDKVSKATGYTVYRSTKAQKGYKKLATVGKNTYTDYEIHKGYSYYYKIVANYGKKTACSSDRSEAVCVDIRPASPKVNGSYAKGKIKLTWKKIKGADVYYVYKKNAKGKYELVKKTTKLYFSDGTVKKGNSYIYKVCAVKNSNGTRMKSKASSPYTVLASSVDPNKKMVALTYDDGPGQYTEAIVRCLKENQGKATFFVLGCNIDSYRKALKEADEIGCEIGNHTYTHSDMSRLSKEKIVQEIKKTDGKIRKVIGKKSSIMRPPYGSIDDEVEDNVGKPIILWSIDTKDWEHRNSSQTIREVMDHVRDGDIVLMHDIYASTKTASLTLIPQLRREGYQLVTVSELAKNRSYKIQKGKTYHRFRKK